MFEPSFYYSFNYTILTVVKYSTYFILTLLLNINFYYKSQVHCCFEVVLGSKMRIKKTYYPTSYYTSEL